MLPTVDPEIAGATFWNHLTDLWAKKGREEKWGIIPYDNLHCIMGLHARNAAGDRHPYFLKLGAEYYDAGPPTVKFVEPTAWKTVREASRWWPKVNCPPWLGLHLDAEYEDKHRDQLICFSFTAEFYFTNHNPGSDIKWTPGRHTVGATLHRVLEFLSPPHYQGPSA